MLIFSEQSYRDLDGIREYYRDISKRLSKKAFKSVIDTLKLIDNNPFIGRVVIRNIRKKLTLGFPFVIYYKVADDKIVILNIIHTSRDNKYH